MAMMASRVALLLSYDGTPYRGWTDVRDVAVRPALAKIIGADDEPPKLKAASRTDAGVHAAGQVCTFSSSAASASDCEQLAYSLNQLLPPEVAVRSARSVDASFDPRSTLGKTYLYRLSTRPGSRDPLRRLYEWHRPPRRGASAWDADAVADVATALCGTHSFAAFANRPRGGERNVAVDPVCTLAELSLAEDATTAEEWTFTVRGDRFLYKMVRNLVGALVKVGTGELASDELVDALEHGEWRGRGASVPLTAPAHGLLLQRVEYASDPFGVTFGDSGCCRE